MPSAPLTSQVQSGALLGKGFREGFAQRWGEAGLRVRIGMNTDIPTSPLEMIRNGESTRDLADQLGENERSFANRLSRGAFTVAFMMQCLDAIGSPLQQLD